MNYRLAECVGLWLAEGDTKTKAEITFTNNCWELIELFSNTICRLFKEYKFNPRIYVYSKETERPNIKLSNHTIKFYIDNRARKPYFIFRLASVKIVKEWKKIVNETKNNEGVWRDILRGFFAGEGNIKTGSHSNRTLRIAQKNPDKLVEQIMDYVNLTYNFRKKERNYYLTGKWNWDIFAYNKLTKLHPDKNVKFWESYNEYKEEHYPHLYLKKGLYKQLSKPYTTSELAAKFSRSQARICQVLIELKREGKIKNFRVKSKDYWTNNKRLIIISYVKNSYLKLLRLGATKTSDFAKELSVDWKSANNRLKELEKLNLVNNLNNEWIITNNKREVMAL